jgi:hypothetical protein
MAATITFTDTVAFATLTALGDRLNNWTPQSAPVQDMARRLGSGAIDVFTFRAAPRVSFALLFENAQMAVAERLRYHLLSGGVCTVNTGDTSDRSYDDMALAPDTEPTLTRVDRESLDYEFSVGLEYVGTSLSSMVCLY